MWEETSKRHMGTELRKGKLCWIGDTVRKPSDDIVKQEKDLKPKGNRRIGRPEHT